MMTPDSGEIADKLPRGLAGYLAIWVIEDPVVCWRGGMG